ncbi:hypothetical protein [Streptosporangium sp. LJ11]|uniref:hypothetical protein n=1 Tax=Streptosporangium sp. LJ11 TaxID=3436927 RepID=UPI003F79F7A1
MHSLPDALTSTFQDALVCSCIGLTKDERARLLHAGANGTLGITAGLTYPDKAERARRDPRVALPYTGEAAAVLVQGRAAVRDADLQANTDRFVRHTLAKTSSGFSRRRGSCSSS